MASEDDLVVEVGLTEKQYLRSLARLEAATLKTAGAAEKRFRTANQGIERGFTRADAGARRFAGGGLRQVSLQLSQVAQQGSATGNYLQALAIQLPDIGIMFGTVGIAAGVVAGALVPLIGNMVNLGDASGALEEDLKSLDAAMQRLESARSQAGTGLSDLRGEYGALADEAQRLFEIERQIAEIEAQRAFGSAVGSMADNFGISAALGLGPEQIRASVAELGRLRSELQIIEATRARARQTGEFFNSPAAFARSDEIVTQINAMGDLERQIEDVAEALGISTGAAAEFAALLSEVHNADTAADQASAMQRMAEHIFVATDGLRAADDEMRELYDGLLSGARAALDLAAIDMASGIGAGADQAARLAGNLSAAAIAAVNLANLRASKVYSGRGGDPRAFMEGGSQADYESSLDYTPPAVFIERAAGGGGGRGGGRSRGGGGGRDAELTRLMGERDRILRSLETATDKYNRELADLNKLQEMGEITAEQYGRALAGIEEELVNAEFGNVIRQIDDVASALAGAIVNGENLGDAIVGSLRRIVAEAIAADIRTAALSLFSGGGKGGGLLGTLLGGLIGGARAAGGPVSAGRAYWVGEHGPEPFVPSENGSILSATQAQEALRAGPGGGGMATVRVDGGDLTLTDDGRIMAQVRVSSAQARSGAVGDVKASWGAFASTYDQDGRLV